MKNTLTLTLTSLCLLFGASIIQAQDKPTPTPRIVGGQDTPISAIPFQVAIIFNGTNSDLNCGGSLISNQWVLTAAHCVYDFDTDKVQSPSTYQVVAGRTQLSSFEGQIFNIENIIVHENYTPSTEENDLALLKLKSPVDLEAVGASTIKILTKAEEEAGALDEDKLVTISGWGATNSNGSGGADNLQSTQVRVVPNSVANAAESYHGAVTEGMLAAGISAGGKDACSGDSGGPLTVELDDGTIRLAGIVSWGIGCAQAEYPGIYARVPFYQDWIYRNFPVKEGLFISEVQPTNAGEGFVEIYNAGAGHSIQNEIELHIQEQGSAEIAKISLTANDSLQTDSAYVITQNTVTASEGFSVQQEAGLAVSERTIVGLYHIEQQRYIDVYGLEEASTFWYNSANQTINRRDFVAKGNYGFFNTGSFFEWEIKDAATLGSHQQTSPLSDIWLQSIIAPSDGATLNLCTPSFNELELFISNAGRQEITNLEILLELKGDETTRDTIRLNFLDNPISVGQSLTIDVLKEGVDLRPTITQNYTLTATLLKANNVADDVALNNTAVSTFKTSEVFNNALTFVIRTDDFGSEITWRIENEAGELAASGGSYPDVEGGQLVQEAVCLLDGCYRLRVIDSFGDGIFGDSFFRLEDENSNIILERDGNFEEESAAHFCIPLPPIEVAFSVNNPVEEGTCGADGFFIPSVTIRNNGADALTSTVIRYGTDDFTASFTWEGNLQNAEEATVNLSPLPLAEVVGTFPFKAKAENFNSLGDDKILTNNQVELNYRVGESLQLQLQLDDYPEENSLLAFDEAGNLLQEISFKDYTDFTNIDMNICVPAGCSSFLILDSFGDGITNGSYTISTPEGIVLASGDGDFESNSPNSDATFDDFSACLIPGQPRKLEATVVSPSEIQLNWVDRSLVESQYEVQRSLAASINWETIVTLPENSTNFKDSNVEAQTEYAYRIVANRSLGNLASDSVFATTLPLRPEAPTNLSVVEIQDTFVLLSWTDNASSETAFTIWRSETSPDSGFNQIAEVEKDVTKYTDSSVSPDDILHYKVQAVGFEPSEFSNTVTVNTLPLSLEPGAENATWSVFPNPSTGKFVLEWGDGLALPQENLSIQILDLQGRVLQQETLLTSEIKEGVSIDLSAFAKGIYILKTEIGFQKLVLK